MEKFSAWAVALTGIALALFSLSACQATHLSAVKKDPTYDPRGMRRVFVVAVMQTDRGQKMLEDEFVRQLNGTGRQAVASYTMVPHENKLDPEAWKELIRANGWDTVIVSRLVDMKVVEKEFSEKVNYPHYGSGYGYYGMPYAAAYKPSSYVREQTASIETKVFDVAGGKEVWSAHSKTDITWGGDPVPQIRTYVETLIKEARQ